MKTITPYGSDGTTAFPATTLTYNLNRVSVISNGIGGSVTFSSDRITIGAPISYQGGSYTDCSTAPWGGRLPTPM